MTGQSGRANGVYEGVSAAVLETAEKYQLQLLEQARYIYRETPISEPTVAAYLATPRHAFVRRYREWGTKKWHEVGADNLAEHLATLYADRGLIRFGDDDNNVPSSISQPSFMLRMLDMLQLRRGDTVFELGAGSGWNAALIGHLVGAEGHVYSVEIIPEVAQMAAETIEASDIRNVHIIEADGGEGYPAGAPYDRAIFTAGTYDLPRNFYDQVRENGLLLIVIKNPGGGDNLFLLRKGGAHFESLESMPCAFVPLRGKYQIEGLEPISLETLPAWAELRGKEISRTRFWWGGVGGNQLMWRTLAVRSFLGIVEPSFRAFKTGDTDRSGREEHYFGLWDSEAHSLVIAKDDWLVAYGNSLASERLHERLRQWVDLGMPTAASFGLQVSPADEPLTAAANQWLIRRPESQFLWTLDRR